MINSGKIKIIFIKNKRRILYNSFQLKDLKDHADVQKIFNSLQNYT